MSKLEERLVLHRFMCNQFGHAGLRQLLDVMGRDGDASDFCDALMTSQVNFHDQMRDYDENIRRISKTLKINGGERSWKPFQYLALLFTERYLDLYFSNVDELLEKLNQYNRDRFARKEIPPYTADDLRKLAFQSATGSGKTLLLHANLLQYQHYLQKHNHLHKLNKIILITPDEGLSNQHLREMRASGISARLFSDGDDVGSLPGKNTVDIIDLHKLAEKKGIKRVALEAFEDNNLILVDEGHLGVGGTTWREHRKQLAENGFTFEYSATFNQAVAGSGAGIAELRDEYGKSILFDYSYKFFHEDGYGKNYHITNLRSGDDDETKNTYLLGCLLMFYQQCKVFAESAGAMREYNLTPPLWMFLGRTVTGQKTGGNAKTKSDVVTIVRFLAWVLNNSDGRVADDIARIVSGNSGLLDEHDVDLFTGRLRHIGESPAEIYADICARIFNGRGQLQAMYLSGEGELQLHTGKPDEPFGVINVGDSSGLYALLERAQSEDEDTANNFHVAKNDFANPQFADVDKHHSPINIVIGARKFVAGWNSWRVSTMGLLHVGTGQGPQIIQMFGRGVRLKGRGMSLKRHNYQTFPPTSAVEKLGLLETLNVFGLRAKYMEQFNEYLRRHGIHAERVHYLVPTAKIPPPDGLKTIKMRDDVGEFRHSDEALELPDKPPARFHAVIDRRPHLQTETVADQPPTAATPLRSEKLDSDMHVALMNHQSIYHRVILRKQQNGWHNLAIAPHTVTNLLKQDGWYTLRIPHEKMALSSYDRVREWEDLAVDLICEYAKNVWQHARQLWEHKHVKAVALDDDDGNLVHQYSVSISKQKKRLIKAIGELIQAVENGEYDRKFPGNNIQLSLLAPEFHAYIPLLHVDASRARAGKNNEPPAIKVSPAALNSGEKDFVDLLVELHDVKPEVLRGKTIYLMRNLSRGKGVSFFNNYSFYPDFILWVKDKDSARQDVLFIDPKGISRHDKKVADKMRMHEMIKDIEKRMHSENHSDLFLHSYIWSTTSYSDAGNPAQLTPSQYNQQGVYFAGGGTRSIMQMLQHALTNP